ncbi:MAG TPA: hypothetical protein VL048_00575 [Xanthobacteraceae bacterium]|nr:hypothetical protein [Xanthobacteraceae bacterium]
MRAWQALVLVVLTLTVSAVRAETVEVAGDYGGFLVAYEAKWKKLADENANVRIAGPCVSACTVLAGYIPRDKICATPKGSLGFHLAFPYFITPTLWKDYPPDIQAWITKKGGLSYSLMWMQAPEIYHFFKRCPGT